MYRVNFLQYVVVSHLFGSDFIKEAPSKAVHDVTQHIQGKGIWIQQVDAHLTNCNAGLALTAAVHQKQSTYIHSLTHSFIYSLTCSLTHSLTHSLAHSLTHSLARSFIHSTPKHDVLMCVYLCSTPLEAFWLNCKQCIQILSDQNRITYCYVLCISCSPHSISPHVCLTNLQ